MLESLLKDQQYVFYWAAMLVALGVAMIIVAVWACWSAVGELRAATTRIGEVKALPMSDRRFGLALEQWERLRQVGTKLPIRTAGLWGAITDSVECYTSPEGRDGYFVTRTLDEASPERLAVRRYYPADLLQTAPGVITSLGLLGTFLALLLGLKDVTPNTDGGFNGIGKLIAGLSGKFVTSIVALGISVVVLLLNQHLCQPLLIRRYRLLLTAIGDRLPYLTPSRVLLDVQRLNVKQARSLSNISSEFIGAFKEVFASDLAPILAQGLSVSIATQLQSELGPTLGRVDDTMRELATSIQRLEATKQESVVEEIRGLTSALETSLRNALADMGAQFRDALSASTKDEFGQLATVVQGSAGVLQSMTSSFASMEATLRTIVDEARTSTTAQMSASMEQTQRLNLLVEGLMTRLNQAAQTNFESVGAVLTNVVAQLSEQVTKLSQDLVQTVQSATQQTEASATATLTKAGEWSAQTGAQLSELLATLQSKSTDFERAGETLLAAQNQLERTLTQNNDALLALSGASNEVRTYTTALAGLQQKIGESQQTQLSLAMQSREAVTRLSEAMDRQAAIVTQYQQTVEQYQRVFGGIDQELDRTLSTILVKMEAYTDGVGRHFDTVLASANKHLPDIAATLQDANDRLREQLDEFIEALERMRRSAA